MVIIRLRAALGLLDLLSCLGCFSLRGTADRPPLGRPSHHRPPSVILAASATSAALVSAAPLAAAGNDSSANALAADGTDSMFLTVLVTYKSNLLTAH